MEPSYMNVTKSKVGVIEYRDVLQDNKSGIHVNEWWNGEGVDIEIEEYHGSKSVKRFSLHYSDWQALRTIMKEFYSEED